MNGIETARRIKSTQRRAVAEDPCNLPADACSSGAGALVRKTDFRPATLRDMWDGDGE